MPDRWAVANGNWSSTATWNSGGSLGIPTGSDDVYANNFTVDINQSFQVLSLRNTVSASAIVAGGSFNFNSGSISGSCTGTNPLVNTSGVILATFTHNTGSVTINATNRISFFNSTNYLISMTSNGDVTINAPFIGVPGGISATVQILSKGSGTGTLTINSNIDNANSFDNATAMIALNSGNVIINGDAQLRGNYNNARLLSINGANVTLNGNLTNLLGQTGNQVVLGGTSGNATINGNIIGNQSPVVSALGTLNITYNGGSITTSTATPVVFNSAGTLNVNSNISSSGVTIISSTTACLINISGSILSGPTTPAVVSTNVSATNIFTGPFINTNDTMAVQCVDMVLTQDASTSWNFGDITLFSPGRLAFYPSASDIRQGVTYADGTVSGSLAMPPPTAVIAGTPTDNTTGSAVLTVSQLESAFWGAPLSQMTDTGSIGARLAKSATLDSTGNQLASYLI